MKPCKHTFVRPIRCEKNYQSYEPGICGLCGAMIDIRTGQAMTPIQVEAWTNELVEQRVAAVKTTIYISEVTR